MPFPETALDRPDVLLELLGSFWSGPYSPLREELAAYVTSLADRCTQVRADRNGAADALARRTVPRRRREEWTRVVLRESELTAPAPLLIGGFTIGDGSLVGGSLPGPGRSTAAPFHWAPLLQDRMVDPQCVLTGGIDYTIDDGRMRFAADPFADTRLSPEPVRDAAGVTVDRRLIMWACGAETDHGDLYDRHGAALGAPPSTSTASYARLVDALALATAGGTARGDLEKLLEAACGVLLAAEDGVVEAVWREPDATVVATDSRVYRYALSAEPTVAPGDTVRAGQALCDGLLLAEPRGTPPSWMTAISLDDSLLAPGLHGVVLHDADEPLEVATAADGYTRVSCRLGGRPEDVERFWDEVHERGVAAGTTLAMLLDVRPEPVGQPGAASLPATLNPLRFFLAHALRQHLVVARLRPEAGAGTRRTLDWLRYARLLLPPHVALVAFVEPPALVGTAIVDASGTLTAEVGGVTEGVAEPGISGRLLADVQDCGG